MEGRKENDIRAISHIMLVVTIAIFSLVLVLLNILLEWEKWTIPLLLFAVVLCFVLHITQRLAENIRIIIYAIILMVEMFYYCANMTTIFDCTPVVLVILILISITQEKLLTTLCVLVGFAGMIFQVVSTALETPGYAPDLSTVVRTVWHMILLFLGATIVLLMIGAISRMESDFKQTVSSLEGVNRSASDFLANVSHEIRTPINAVIGLTGVILEKENDPSIRPDLLAVEAAGKRVAEQISDILDYSEIDMDSLAVNSEDYMLSSVLNDLVTQLAPAKAKGIELVIDVESSIPTVMHTDVYKFKKILWHLISNSLKYTPEGGVYVHISSIPQDYGINLMIEVSDTGIGMSAAELERVSERFYQANSGRTRSTSGLGLGMSIVAGFVSALNGFMTVESVPNKGTTVRVSIPQRVVNAGECMSVRDRQRLSLAALLHFEKFPNAQVREYYNAMLRDIVAGLHVQMHRVETVENLKKLVENVKLSHLFVGEEEYRSDIPYLERLAKDVLVCVVADRDFQLPAGSHIRVLKKPFYCFPVITILNMNVGDIEEEEGRLSCPGVRALVVDDEPMNLTVSTGIFSRYGMVVTTAGSGLEAINLCKNNEYDIIFMDHMMPGMDGVEAMKRIRGTAGKSRNDIPIVALTANAVSTAREMFIAEGFDAFVSKPVELIELERALRKVLPKSLIMDEVESDKPSASEKVEEEAKTKVSAAELFGPLKELGVDIDKGLHYCQNDGSFYQSLLLQFSGDSKEKRENASKFYQANDLANYAIIVHALKSTAKMIGALSLSDEALELELAAKEGRRDYIRDNHAVVMAEYEKLTDQILLRYAPPEQSSDGDPDDDILEFSPATDVKPKTSSEEILEFGPVNKEEEILEFGPKDNKNDDDGILEFSPKGGE